VLHREAEVCAGADCAQLDVLDGRYVAETMFFCLNAPLRRDDRRDTIGIVELFARLMLNSHSATRFDAQRSVCGGLRWFRSVLARFSDFDIHPYR